MTVRVTRAGRPLDSPTSFDNAGATDSGPPNNSLEPTRTAGENGN